MQNQNSLSSIHMRMGCFHQPTILPASPSSKAPPPAPPPPPAYSQSFSYLGYSGLPWTQMMDPLTR